MMLNELLILFNDIYPGSCVYMINRISYGRMDFFCTHLSLHQRSSATELLGANPKISSDIGDVSLPVTAA